MANRQKGWDKLNRMKQMEANKSRGKVEKVVTREGEFLFFMLTPAKRLVKGWNTRNDHKREKIAIAEAARKEHLPRKQRRRATLAARKDGKSRMNYRRAREAKSDET